MRYVVDVLSCWARDYAARAQLAVVYIQEAHAVDEWPISSVRLSRLGLGPPQAPAGSEAGAPAARGQPVCLQQATSLAQRLEAARAFVHDYGVDEAAVAVCVDEMGNRFQDTYAAWPLRWYVFRASGAGEVRVTQIGEPEDASFHIEEIGDLLLAL